MPTEVAVNPDRRLVNLSTRALVRTGDEITIAGFILAGTDTKRLLIRAAGPRLAAFGITAGLADPAIQVVRLNPDGGTTEVLANDNWASGPNADQIISTSAQVGAFPLNANLPSTNDVLSAVGVVDLARRETIPPWSPASAPRPASPSSRFTMPTPETPPPPNW